ncbi:MAG: hypothetical protein KBB51_03945 [Candidatus Moranbacteria bacterium]|nr:hypothetical protein [Candidatus Moranbacteria bacterium]
MRISFRFFDEFPSKRSSSVFLPSSFQVIADGYLLVCFFREIFAGKAAVTVMACFIVRIRIEEANPNGRYVASAVIFPESLFVDK